MLKSLNFSELERFRERLASWRGAQVQEIAGTATEVGLRLHQQGENLYLWIDLDAKAPVILWFEESFPAHRKATKPVHLFLQANLQGAHFSGARLSMEEGRVLYLEFDEEEIELRLFPHGRNLSVSAGGKTLSWSKQKELRASVGQTTSEFAMRPWGEVESVWKEAKRPGRSAATVDELQAHVQKLKKDLKKKKRALEKLEEKMNEENSELYQKAGFWLQSFGAQDFPDRVPDEYASFFDFEKSRVENIQLSFQKYEKSKAKREGRKGQRENLLKEIERLNEEIENPRLKKKGSPKTPENLLRTAQAKGRTRHFGDFEAVIGKSAADNLAILRRAKPWYLWMHLKDQPGAYVILRRNKKQEVSQADLQEVFQWLLRESVPASEQEGRHEVLLAECRHVRPIKGDRMGRVMHQNAQVLSFSKKL